MLSGIDIRDWTEDDFTKIVSDLPEDQKKVSFNYDEGGDAVLDLRNFINAFGHALVAKVYAEVSSRVDKSN